MARGTRRAYVIWACLTGAAATAGGASAPDAFETITRLALFESLISRESRVVAALRATITQELTGQRASLPVQDGYSVKVHRTPAGTPGVAYTAVPTTPGTTGVHGFCMDDNASRVCYTADGTPPAVTAGRCSPSCRELPADGPAAVLDRPTLTSEAKRALLAALDSDPRFKGVPSSNLEAWRMMIHNAAMVDPRASVVRAHPGAVMALAFIDGGTLASVAYEAPEVKLWSLDGSPPRRVPVPGCRGPVALATVPAVRALVVGCSDGAIKQISLSASAPARDLARVEAGMVSLDVAGGTLAVATRNRVEVRELPAGRLRVSIPVPGAPMRTLAALAPDGARVGVMVSDPSVADAPVTLWDGRSGAKLATLANAGPAHATALRFTPDGSHVISALSDYSVRAWNVATGKAVARAREHGAVINALATAVDGARLLSASSDSAVKVWSLPDLRVTGTLRGHTGEVFAVAVSPDGRRAASGDSEGAVIVWDVDERAEVLRLRDPGLKDGERR